MKSPCLLLACAALMGSSDAFMVSPNPTKSQLALSYSSGTTLPLPDPMFGASRVMGGSRGGSSKTVPSTTAPGRPAHIQEVMTMDEYNKVVAAEKDQVVVVRFYAPWCRACKAMAPSYYKFSKDLEQKNVKFVDCPYTPLNADLHASLGVESIPLCARVPSRGGVGGTAKSFAKVLFQF
ncbi:hypothetical protein MHU86_2422 [Fragilaria crotonensis]|nr:hypothetical protein MHU86_2422 [Fragilaria crotonensis]